MADTLEQKRARLRQLRSARERYEAKARPAAPASSTSGGDEQAELESLQAAALRQVMMSTRTTIIAFITLMT